LLVLATLAFMPSAWAAPDKIDVQFGKMAYDKVCAECHGPEGKGSKKGPPLIHPFYNPGHHSDTAFFMAVRNGVKRHHWNFGDMPAQPKVQDDEIAQIIRYVRQIQEAHGIVYREHRM
jgi:mono/diheme cytochrome c family protein